MDGNSGDDRLFGGDGNDFIRGSSGDDAITGGTGTDTLCGCGGDDHLMGGNDGDACRGGTCTYINTGSGTDQLEGCTVNLDETGSYSDCNADIEESQRR